jgi:hypothetical protein
MSQQSTIPINGRAVFLTLTVVLLGLGMMSGSALGKIGELYGLLFTMLGFLYAIKQYKKQKKALAGSGKSPTATSHRE